MPTYLSRKHGLKVSCLIAGLLVQVRFRGGVFITEDPALEAALDAHPRFGTMFTKDVPPPMTKNQAGVEKRRGKTQTLTNLKPLAEALEKADAKEKGAGTKASGKKEGTEGKES